MLIYGKLLGGIFKIVKPDTIGIRSGFVIAVWEYDSFS